MIENLSAAILAIPTFEQIIYNIDNEYEVAGVIKLHDLWWKGKAVKANHEHLKYVDQHGSSSVRAA